MCFSATQSLTFALVGLATTLTLLWRGRSWKYVALTAYFTVMEVLQFLQYMVIDRCDSKLNQLLTMLAYIHVSFQPLVWNEFVFGLPQPAFNKPIISKSADPILHWAVRRLSLAASLLLVLKGTPAFLHLLGLADCTALHSLLGEGLSSYLLGPGTSCNIQPEMICGEKLCSIQGKFHVGWSVPSLPHSYYVPTAALHFYFFFLPALVLGGPPQWMLSAAAFVTGPLATEWVLRGDPDARRHEWAAIWCMFSLGQVLILFAVELAGTTLFFNRPHLPARDPTTTESLFSSLLPASTDEQPQPVASPASQPAAPCQAALLTEKPASPAGGLLMEVFAGSSGSADGASGAAAGLAGAVEAGEEEDKVSSPTPRRSSRLRQRPGR